MIIFPWKQTALLPLDPPAVRSPSLTPQRLGPGRHFLLMFLILQATKTVHWGGGFWFACFTVRKRTFLRDKLSFIFQYQKEKAARVHRACFRKTKYRETAFEKSSVENSLLKLTQRTLIRRLRGVTSSSFCHRRGSRSLACATLESFTVSVFIILSAN